ncbi:hypothetical protein QRX50_03665 [Amycolatopsis carbonis]|uniref:MFS transporter n=1 Tax=Amycolatopsis carbonis TaxID=715471 RepID=A0A9Y2IGG5_9PSEU|nr:hypothetical protein [Amycolatopsis sp. 2-15]WIX79910.1 hypothetical protein QRX50_03665 [Amycolatopsis sp. 2-15]
MIAAGQITFAFSPDGLGTILAALALMGLGTSQVMPNANSAMNQNAEPHAGVAGAVGPTLQQLGGSVGLALPVALAAAGSHATSLAVGVTAVALLAGSVLALRQPRATTDRPPASNTERFPAPTDPPR